SNRPTTLATLAVMPSRYSENPVAEFSIQPVLSSAGPGCDMGLPLFRPVQRRSRTGIIPGYMGRILSNNCVVRIPGYAATGMFRAIRWIVTAAGLEERAA